MGVSRDRAVVMGIQWIRDDLVSRERDVEAAYLVARLENAIAIAAGRSQADAGRG